MKRKIFVVELGSECFNFSSLEEMICFIEGKGYRILEDDLHGIKVRLEMEDFKC